MDVTKTHIAHDFAHGSPLISCRFDPTGQFVFAGAQDYRVCRWEIATGTKTELTAVNAWVRGLAFDSAGQTMVTAGYDGRLTWWPVEGESPEPLRSIDAHHGWARAVAVSPDDSLLASVGNDLKVKLWSMADGSLIREMSGHESHIYNVAFHPSGNSLVTGDLKCNLIEWNVADGAQVRTWKAESLIKYDGGFRADIGGFRGLSFSPDGKRLACSGITNVTNAFAGIGNPRVVVFDWEAVDKPIEHSAKGKLEGVAWGVAIHPDGTTIAASGGRSGGRLLFWRPGEAESFHLFKLPNTARDFDLSSDGLHAATAHYDGHLRISRMAEKSA